MPDETRTLEKEITLAAPPAAVWRALTEGEELRRWFPVDARVDPGVGGKVWISWGPEMAWESAIDIWEPGKHLRLSNPGTPVPFAVDYYIEARGDVTVLRLVNSGFGPGADWDDMYFGMDGGWSYFLYNLRHYLERHPGKPRTVLFRRTKSSAPRAGIAAALARLLGAGDVFPATGSDVTVPLGAKRLAGRVGLSLPNHLAIVVPELDDALLFFELEPGPNVTLGAYLSIYGPAPANGGELEEGVRALGEAAAGPASAA